MTEVLRVERGRYHDSVTLLWASAAVRDVAGVETAIVALATELNLELLVAAGFAQVDATADDLVVAVRCDTQDTADEAVATIERILTERQQPARSSGSRQVAPHTVEAAAGRAPDAGVVLVSVPGAHAYVEAVAALRAGRHVMVFSDGIDLATEVTLKREAAKLGRLVMGPDCGTVILDGVGLGFANVVSPGPVGLVAASGTGAQQVCCLLDGAGIGVRHVVGVGGRDLSTLVGGLSTQTALVALDADPSVEVIGVVAKVAAPAVAAAVAATAAGCRTPVVFAFVGPGHPTLTDAAAAIAARLAKPFTEPVHWPASARPAPDEGRSESVGGGAGGASAPASAAAATLPAPVLGLFSGGTNAAEALVVLEARLGPVRSNVHHDRSRRLGPRDDPTGAHAVLDLGDDELTVGRPHPMIDPLAVADRLHAAVDVPAGPSVVLLDVVLGHGAHPDPAPVLAPALAAATEAGVHLVVTLVGTDGDPQGLGRQARVLVDAGASVHRSNARAAEHAAALASGAGRRPVSAAAERRDRLGPGERGAGHERTPEREGHEVAEG